MPEYKPYPTVKTTVSRRARKSDRNKVFSLNKAAGKLARRLRRAARNAQAEVVEE